MNLLHWVYETGYAMGHKRPRVCRTQFKSEESNTEKQLQITAEGLIQLLNSVNSWAYASEEVTQDQKWTIQNN